MQNRDHDGLDAMLDQALSGYAGGAPLAGLEERVFKRIRAARAKQQQFRLWDAALAVGVFAAILLVVIERPPGLPPRPVMPPVPEIFAEINDRHDRISAIKVPLKAKSVRRIPVVTDFTGEERAMLALVRYQPAEPPAFTEPPDIEPIRIQPLEADGVQPK